MVDDLLTTADAARELGIDRSRVLRLISGGRLLAGKHGRDYVIRRTDLNAVRDRRPGQPRKGRTTMTLYHTPTLPQHWIVRTPGGEMFLAPAISDGWAQRTPYRGYVRGLSEVAPETSRLALLSLGAPSPKG